jgi:hypothetical protein
MYEDVVHPAGSNSGVIGPYGCRIDKVLTVRQAAEHRRFLDDAFFQLGIFAPNHDVRRRDQAPIKYCEVLLSRAEHPVPLHNALSI